MTDAVIVRLIADIAVIPVVLLGAYALILKVPKGQRYRAYCRVLMAGLTSYLIAKLVGTIYQPSEQRPFEILGVQPGASYLDNPGFPSDHALFVTAIALAVWFETRQKILSLVVVGLVILVCIGRVAALVHTPLDIIGGVSIALIGALWYLQNPQVRKEQHGKSSRRRSGHRAAA